MRVLFVTSECTSLYKLGGLGDVSYSLPIALHEAGAEVAITLPFYENITVDGVKSVGQIGVDFNGERETVFIFKTFLKNTKVPVYLFRHPVMEHYHSSTIVEAFAFFSVAVAHTILYTPDLYGGKPDIIHCHDWHTGLVPVLVGENKKATKDKGQGAGKKKNHTIPDTSDTLEARESHTVLTIHNLLYQGSVGVELVDKLNLPRSLFHMYKNADGKQYIKLMREGLEFADVVTTVSPTYANEIYSPEFGEHIQQVLLARKDKVVGIVNGIDTASWNPENDKALESRYSQETVIRNKSKNKIALQKELGLMEAHVPLFAFIGRIDPHQKGVALIRQAVEEIMKTNLAKSNLATLNSSNVGNSELPQFQLVILGTGDKEESAALTDLAKKYHRVKFVNAFDEELARRIYGASDFILVPSKFEPCGLIQIIAMRYGTVPIVRKTGGLADTVVDGKTGFVFEEYDEKALAAKILTAISMWFEKPEEYHNMVCEAMKVDFSWKASAKEYVELYRKMRK